MKHWMWIFVGLAPLAFAQDPVEAKPAHWSEWESVRVAACQVAQGPEAVDLIVDYADRAGSDGAEMLVCPEYVLGAFTEDSPKVRRIAEAARRNGIYLVVGGWEEYEEGAAADRTTDAYANTILLFGRDGSIEGRFDKVHPAVGGPPHFWPPQEGDGEWHMKPGDAFPTFQLDFARVGIMTCYDGYFSESAAVLSLKGAEIILWPNGRMGMIEPHFVKADCARNFVAMVATNTAAGSGTVIANFPGTAVARVEETGNHYITGEINLEGVRLARTNARMHHQRRPALYRALVEDHRPWEVYEQHGYEAAEAPPR